MSNEQFPNNNLTQNIDEGINPPTSPNQPITQNKVPQPSSPQQFKALKIILGIATFWPIFYLGTLVLLSIIAVVTIAFTWGSGPLAKIFSPLVTSLFLFLEKILYPTIILMLVLSFIYNIILFSTKRYFKKGNFLWTIIFILGIFSAIFLLSAKTTKIDFISMDLMITLGILVIAPYIAMSIYWYRYIWKEPKQNH